MVDDPAALAAVWNNAGWCDAVATAHGCRTLIDDLAWTSATRTPPFYPDAVTRSRAVQPAHLLARIDTGEGCGVKDSFACLDLATQGFHVLLEATWIRRAAAEPARTPEGWVEVRTPAGLASWERAWSGGDADVRIFPESLAGHPACRFVAALEDGAVVAGAVLHDSHGVVGISNLFAPPERLERTWSEVVALAGTHGLPMVGWESGDDLDAARLAGFEAGGPLRVWVR